MRIPPGSQCVLMLICSAAGVMARQSAVAAVSSACSQVRSHDFEFSRKGTPREIEDAGTGTHWLLLRDQNHPGGPGRLLFEGASGDAHCTEVGGMGSVRQPIAEIKIPQRPIIRAGDRLVVLGHSGGVDVELEGVALTPASAGAVLKVRLSFSGGMVQAIAVQPGQATLAAGMGLRQ